MKNRYSKFVLLLLTILIFNSPAAAQYTETIVNETAMENPTTNWVAGDDDTLSVNIGFDFPFGGLANINQIYINSNGALSLSVWDAYGNQALSIGSPSTVIAPYWDDINRPSGGTIKYSTLGSEPNRRFVVGWNNTPRFPNTGSCTFQVVLYETGNIRFRYSTGNNQCSGGSATVGIQESSASFIQHSYNQIIDLSKDLLYTPVSPPPPPPPPAPPLVLGGCDDFENNLDNWNINTSGGFITTSSSTAQSPTKSLDINGGNANATSIPIDTTNNFKEVTVWVRRGSDTFSEDPDANEDFFIEYLNSSGSWTNLETFLGSGTKGEIYTRTYPMPANAKHANFRLRLRMASASGGNYDHWHIDDVCLVPDVNYPVISMQKTSSVISDGINATNPKRIPGALIEYDITATNSGAGAADNNTIVISDAIPANTALYVNDISGAGTGPIRFVDGSPSSGLSYSFISLASAIDNLSFSNDGGTYFTYSPSADANGTDSNVTHIRISPQGSFLAPSGLGNPSFTIKFRVVVE